MIICWDSKLTYKIKSEYLNTEIFNENHTDTLSLSF